MKCPICGAIVDGLERCDECGTPVSTTDLDEQSKAQSLKDSLHTQEGAVLGTEQKKETESGIPPPLQAARGEKAEAASGPDILKKELLKEPSELRSVHPDEQLSSQSNLSLDVTEDRTAHLPINEAQAQRTRADAVVADSAPRDMETGDLEDELNAAFNTAVPEEATTTPSPGIRFQPIRPSSGHPAESAGRPPEISMGPASIYLQDKTVSKPGPPDGTQLQSHLPGDVQNIYEGIEPQSGVQTISGTGHDPVIEASSSPFLSGQGKPADVTSYDFQTSIYFKQAMGESSTAGAFNKPFISADISPAVSEAESKDRDIPPSFARSYEKGAKFPDRQPASHIRSTGSFQTVRTFAMERKDKRGVVFDNLLKITILLITAASFFFMDVLEAIQSGPNPYDKLYNLRYIIFTIISILTVITIIIKNFTRRAGIAIPLILVFSGLVLYGFLNLRISIKPDKKGNFFFTVTDPSMTLIQDNSIDALNPAISPDGLRVLYSIIDYREQGKNPKLGLVEFRGSKDEMKAAVKETPISTIGQGQWYDDNTLIFPDIRMELPPEISNPVISAARNELLFNLIITFNLFSLDTNLEREYFKFTTKLPFSIYLKQIINKSENPVLRQLEKIYTSPEKAKYDFIYSRENKMIAVSAMGGLWLIDPSRGIGKKVTRGGEIGYPYLDTWPEFSSDGKKLYFVRTRIGEKIENDILQLDIAAAFKSEEIVLPQTMTNDIYNYLNFAVSPGGRFIATWIIATQNDGAVRDEEALVLYDLKLDKHIKIFPIRIEDQDKDSFVSYTDWSRNGKYIVFQANKLLNSAIRRIDLPKKITLLDKE